MISTRSLRTCIPCIRIGHISQFHHNNLPSISHSTHFFSTNNQWTNYLSSQPSSSPIHSLLKDKSYINGQWVSSDSNETFDILDPATLLPITSVPNCGPSETQAAIQAASDSLRSYQSLSLNERCNIVHKIHLLLTTHADYLARIITIECGKPLSEAKGEILYTSSFFKWFAEEGRRSYGDIIPGGISNERRILVTKEPVGICGIITPWNFPAAMIARKLAPALVVGCPSIIKPAPETPLSALALIELCERAGVPPGVINVLTSDNNKSKDIGSIICNDKRIRKLSFTGSTTAGIILGSQAITTMKRISLELGGNAPFIVFDDANINNAVQGALVAKYRNAGQTCVCTNRFYIHKKIRNEFVEKFTQTVKNNIKLGHGYQDGVQQGPLITQNGLEKVEKHVEDAIKLGGEVVYGGKRGNVNGCERGHFYEPTVIDKVNKDSVISREETFGPIAAIYEFEDEDDVVNMANDTDAGLASYFYTNDLNRAFRVSEKLEYGMVGVNSGLISTEIAPFGGVKFSGLGKEGSKYGLDEYLNIKYTCIDGVK